MKFIWILTIAFVIPACNSVKKLGYLLSEDEDPQEYENPGRGPDPDTETICGEDDYGGDVEDLKWNWQIYYCMKPSEARFPDDCLSWGRNTLLLKLKVAQVSRSVAHF